MKSKVFGGYFFQFVRFVKDDGGVVGKESLQRQTFESTRSAKNKMVIHDDDVGFHRLLAHQRQEAAVVVLALCSKAAFAAGVKPRPEFAVDVPSQLGLVSGFCDLSTSRRSS